MPPCWLLWPTPLLANQIFCPLYNRRRACLRLPKTFRFRFLPPFLLILGAIAAPPLCPWPRFLLMPFFKALPLSRISLCSLPRTCIFSLFSSPALPEHIASMLIYLSDPGTFLIPDGLTACDLGMLPSTLSPLQRLGTVGSPSICSLWHTISLDLPKTNLLWFTSDSHPPAMAMPTLDVVILPHLFLLPAPCSLPIGLLLRFLSTYEDIKHILTQ